jgi:hypothetical protein
MGDDIARRRRLQVRLGLPFRAGRRQENLRILEQGTLFIARWEPEGRRRFANSGDRTPISATEGTGTWREVSDAELVDTQRLIRAAVGATVFDTHFATNRPEDVEVDEDGTVWIALTNNSDVKDAHGSIRTLREAGNDPTATSFTWKEYAAGGPTGRGTGEEGFSSPDNLVFDKAGNLWVVTDISSSSLNVRGARGVPREQRRVHDPAVGARCRDRVPLRQRADPGRGDRAVLHARRAHPVHQHPAPGEESAADSNGAAPNSGPDLVLAQRQQDDGAEPGQAAAVDGHR